MVAKIACVLGVGDIELVRIAVTHGETVEGGTVVVVGGGDPVVTVMSDSDALT